MPTTLQFRRYDTANIANTTGAAGEIFIDLDKETIVVQDGATVGGFPLAREGAYLQANSARDQANSARTQANTAYGQANDAYVQANTARDTANGAYAQSNGAYSQANGAYGQANGAYGQANGAYGQANTGIDTANGAYAQANGAYGQANGAYASANGAYGQANGAYGQANSKVSKSGDTMTGDLNVAASLITQNVIPNLDQIYDLGSPSKRYKDLHLSNSTIYLGSATINANGTKVNVQELNVAINAAIATANITTLNAGAIIATSLTVTDPIIAPSVTDSASYRLRANQTTRGDGTFGVYQGSSSNGNAVISFNSTNDVWQVTSNDIAAIYSTIITTQNVIDSVTSTSTVNAAALNSVKTSYDQATDARNQANTAYGQANAAYADSNTRVLKAGDTMTGALNVQNYLKANVLLLNNTTLSGPSNTSFDGERIRLYDFNQAGHPNYAIGVEGSHIWHGVDDIGPTLGFKWYGNTTLVGLLRTNSTFEVSNTVSAKVLKASGTGTAVDASSGNILTNKVTGTEFAFLNGSYITTVRANNSQIADYTFRLPSSGGTDGFVLATDGTGNTLWSNGIYELANVVRDQANTARDTANGAYAQANGGFGQANGAYAQANGAYAQANGAYAQANGAYGQANLKVSLAGDTMTGNLNVAATLITQNIIPDLNVTYSIGTADKRFKDIYLSGGTIYLGDTVLSATEDEMRANTFNASVSVIVGGKNVLDTANGAYAQANGAYGQANGAYAQANGAYAQANSARDVANGAYAQANGAYGQANGAYAQANGAYDAANNAKVTVYANSGSPVTTQVINYVNTSTVLVSVANTSGNANVTFDLVGTPYDQANAARGQANAAYGEANLKLNLTGGTLTGTLNVEGDLKVTNGNVYLTGNTTYINVSTYQVDDSLLYIAANNLLTDIVDIGFVGGKNTGGTFSHTGLARDASDGTWYLFDNLADSGHVGNVIDFANSTYALLRANISAGTGTFTGNLNVASTLITQNIVPNANVTYDLGTPTKRFKDLYLSNSTIYIGDTILSASGDEMRANTFNAAVSVLVGGVNVLDTANGAYAQANGAYAQANGAYGQANGAYAQANSARDVANGAYAQANGAYGQANIAYGQANAAYTAANNAKVTVFANSGAANATTQTINFVNTSTVLVTVANTAGNANITLDLIGTPYDQANTARNTANDAYTAANNAKVTVFANSGAANATTQTINFVNTSSILVTVANTSGNANITMAIIGTPYDQANAARDQANTARTTANDAYGKANTADTNALNAYGQANSARDQANTARNTANAAYGQANTATTNAGNAYNQANIAFKAEFTSNIDADTNRTPGSYGSYSFGAANTPTNSGILLSLTSSSDGSGDGWQYWGDYGNYTNLYIRGRWGGTWSSWAQMWGSGNSPKPNTVYDQANSAYGAANNRVLKAGDTMTGILVAAGIRNTKNTVDGTNANTSTGAANNINLDESNFFTRTLTASVAFTFRNAPASGNAQSFTLVIVQNATGGYTPSFTNTVYWAGASAPPATTTANARDVWQFTTFDGGTTYYGTLSIKNAG